MGAKDFTARAKGKTPQEAFNAAVARAQFDHGHRGSTGTIAEKIGCDILQYDPPAENQSLNERIEFLVNDEGLPIHDKWGPSGCIYLGDDEYVFFGWAST